MAALAGYASLVKNASTSLATVTNAELDITSDMYETSDLGGGRAKTFLPGMYGAMFPCKLNFDVGDTSGSIAFQSNITASSPATIAFTLSPNAGTNNYTFSGYIQSMKVAASTSTLVTFDASVQVTGAVSYS